MLRSKVSPSFGWMPLASRLHCSAARKAAEAQRSVSECQSCKPRMKTCFAFIRCEVLRRGRSSVNLPSRSFSEGWACVWL